MKKVYIVADSREDYRYDRIIEEIKLLNNETEVVFASSYDLALTSEGVFLNGEKMDISENDKFWFLSNATMNSFAIHKISSLGVKNIWPNVEAVNFADKFLTAVFFAKYDIPAPKTTLLRFTSDEELEQLVDFLGGYPLVMKKNVGSVGRDVRIVKNKEDILNFIEEVHERLKKKRNHASRIGFILQEFIEESAGTDFRVLVLGGKIIGAMKRTAQDGGFRANVSLGGKAEKFELDDELRDLAERIIEAGGIFYGGIDFIKGKKQYLALEINTSAQFKGFEGATGINVAKEIAKNLLS
ncbi:MAG: RimK family alpha-L-glutamate ligase [Candidatus Moranbacteria bacterium]|jgi:RimK family alpha-L-glutamate ligase|nr:RimK family alpha-L-glutamate ligase [Candidatus Moranbacteria bacterium]